MAADGREGARLRPDGPNATALPLSISLLSLVLRSKLDNPAAPPRLRQQASLEKGGFINNGPAGVAALARATALQPLELPAEPEEPDKARIITGRSL
jgi:hypothetical protein